MVKEPHSSLTVTEASVNDIPSLTTLVARSFHPNNAFIRKTLPDTPLLRTWWTSLFKAQLSLPDFRLLVVKSSLSEEHKVIGLLTLSLVPADGDGWDAWAPYGITPDHDQENYQTMVGLVRRYRDQLMRGREHFLVELFGVDHEFAGAGIGSMLLQRACEIADAAGRETFVQANAMATGFYARHGFEVRAQEGIGSYVETMMVRPDLTR